MDKPHLAHLLVELAARWGEAPALATVPLDGSAPRTISFGRLAQEARGVARSLAACGVPAGGRVALLSPNRPEWVLADFGIQTACAVTVPMYPTSTPAQLAYILDDAGISVAFAGGQDAFDTLAGLNGGRGLTLVALDEATDLRGVPGAFHLARFLALGEGAAHGAEVASRLEKASPQDLFTLIYTSGTTGEPKGVMLTHGGLVGCFVPHDARLPGIVPGDPSLCFLPLSHVYERCWTLYALSRGMVVHTLEDPSRVREAFPRVRPAVVCTVPRLLEKAHAAIAAKVEASPRWRRKLFTACARVGQEGGELRREGKPVPLGLHIRLAVADRIAFRRVREAFGGRLKYLPCAGAPLSAELEAFFYGARLPVVHGYGLTETTATVSCQAATGFRFGDVGRPMDGVEVKIAPDGEILVKGPTVMTGYWNKPAETAAAFSDGWFRTGDSGSLDPAGNLTITDRIKDLIKTSGGKLVAPQAIEAAACRDPLIEQAAVVGDLRHFLAALIVPAFEPLAQHARNRGISFASLEDLVKVPEVVALYEEKVAALNRTLARFEQIKRFALLPRPFTIEGGEITPTLKMRRRAVAEKYRELLEALYASEAPQPETV